MRDNKGVNVEGFTYFGKGNEKGSGGGLGIYVKNDHKSIVSPHFSSRDLEILWVSVARGKEAPLFIGVYYGKQESISLEKITTEMDTLREEIMDIRREGEIVLCMDANAKINLMNEGVSRNGRLITSVLEECEIVTLNNTAKCTGTVTRQNRNNQEQMSAIDFVTASYHASNWIKKVEIDESGDYRFRSKTKETDHNTIIVHMNIESVKSTNMTKTVRWNIKAPPEKWMLFREKLAKQKVMVENIMKNKELSFSERYSKFEKILYKALMESIGKTTIKNRFKPKPSNEMKRLRKERRELKKQYEQETDYDLKPKLLEIYKQKQIEIRDKAEAEEQEKAEAKFEKMIRKGPDGYWDKRRKMKRDNTGEWCAMKDENGKRAFDPEENKRINERHYEDLYAKKPVPHHEYHDELEEMIPILANQPDEDRDIDQPPTRKEIEEVIKKKKNKKATTDFDNEILKRGGDEMVDLILPVMVAFWEAGIPPGRWNEGIITNIFKGKGDRERMENQRGITVSSSIGTIAEEILTNRLMATIKFSNAQAG